MKRSKRYSAVAKTVDVKTALPLEEAIKKVKESPVKFDAGVEIHINLNIDPKQSEQLVRSTVVLPHGNGKKITLAAFVTPEQEAEAKEAGADIIGDDSVINEIKTTGKCNFDIAVATPQVMKKLGPIAKTLGQQGLMPSPKTETVGPDVVGMIKALKGGKSAFRNDDGGNVHLLIGRVSYDDAKLVENARTFIENIKKLRPAEVKGTYINTITLSSSMGPGVKVQA